MPLRPLALALLAGLAGLPVEAGAQMVQVSASPVEIAIPYTPLGFGVGVDESSTLEFVGSRDQKTKMTVETTLLTATYVLSVEPLGVQRASTTGPVTLLPIPQDLIVGIKKARGRNAQVQTATLRYEATVPTGPPPSGGYDVHTVIYTITQQ